MASPFYIHLDEIRRLIDQYVLPFVLVVGNITNLANIYLFSRRNLRVNVCSWYFICLSLTHLLVLNILCLSNSIVAWTNYDYATWNPAYCKVRSYLFNLSMVLSRHFMCLISIDRWLITSSRVWLRNLSSIRVTRRLIVASLLFWSIYCVHALIGYESNPFGCYPPSGTTYSFFAAMDAIVTTSVPLIVMIGFSLLALFNLRSHAVRQIQPISIPSAHNAETGGQRSKRNTQLIRLSVLQVFVFIIFNSLWITFAIFAVVAKAETFGYFNYILLTTFLNAVGFVLLFIYAAITFVVYTLASTTFRTECKRACQGWFNTIEGWYRNIL